MKRLIFIVILIITGVIVNAQCNDELVIKAKSMLTEKEVYLNDFKVKLEKANIDDPAPVAKFSQKLKEGNVYVFRVISDEEEYNSMGLLRIYDGDRLIGTNYVKQNKKIYDRLDFKCIEAIDLKLLVTFEDGEAGCAVVIVSKYK